MCPTAAEMFQCELKCWTDQRHYQIANRLNMCKYFTTFKEQHIGHLVFFCLNLDHFYVEIQTVTDDDVIMALYLFSCYSGSCQTGELLYNTSISENPLTNSWTQTKNKLFVL